MLKPRYNTLSESVSDFRRMLDGMNQVQHNGDVDFQELDALVREEQEIERHVRELEHLERMLLGSGMPLSEEDKAQLAREYGQSGEKLMGVARMQRNPEKAARVERRAKGHLAKARKYGRGADVDDSVNESLDPAPLSQYRTPSNALQSFRVLAGLDERTLMPRDAGLLGTTRFNQGYAQMAQPLAEEESPAHKSKMKSAAKKLHQIASTIDQEYEGMDEARSKDQQYSGLAAMYRKYKAKKSPIKVDPQEKSYGTPLKGIREKTTATRRRRLDVAPATVMKKR